MVITGYNPIGITMIRRWDYILSPSVKLYSLGARTLAIVVVIVVVVVVVVVAAVDYYSTLPL